MLSKTWHESILFVNELHTHTLLESEKKKTSHQFIFVGPPFTLE